MTQDSEERLLFVLDGLASLLSARPSAADRLAEAAGPELLAQLAPMIGRPPRRNGGRRLPPVVDGDEPTP